jgi:hypothetical protein
MPIHLPHPVILRRYDHDDGFNTIELRRSFPFIVFIILLLLYLFSTTEEAAIGVTSVGAVLLFAFLWARSMAHGVSAKRQLLSVAMRVGDELKERISLENFSILPILWAEFVDHADLPGHNRRLQLGSASSPLTLSVCTRLRHRSFLIYNFYMRRIIPNRLICQTLITSSMSFLAPLSVKKPYDVSNPQASS